MSTDNCNAENWVPVAVAAQLLGTTPLNVLIHIKRGLLAGVERESGWLVDSESLAALVGRRRAGEVTAVCQSGCGKKASGCGSCG
jgi:hypothetical protein